MMRARGVFHFQKLITLALALVCGGVVGAQGQDAPKITGIREWTFTDGSKERARIRVWEGKVWVGGDGRQTWKKEIDRSIPGQKALLEAVEVTRIHLEHPEVQFSVETPEGPIGEAAYARPGVVIGKEREWKRTDGKVVRGALYNIADDEVSVIIANQAWRIPLASLSEEDNAYLARMMRKQEPVFPLAVACPYIGYGNLEFQEIPPRITGEKFLQRGHPRISFEEALKLAEEHMAAKVDRKSWKLYTMTEHNFSLPPESAAKMKDWNPATYRTGYQVCFQVDESKVRSVREKLQNRVTSHGWYWVYILDDGTFLDIRLEQNKK